MGGPLLTGMGRAAAASNDGITRPDYYAGLGGTGQGLWEMGFNVEGQLGDKYRLLQDKYAADQADRMKIHSFQKAYDPADYNVGAMPSIEEWQSQAPEYEGYKSVKGYQVPGGPSASAVALTDVTSQRDGMKIGDPTIQAVGGQVKNKKKTAGAAASSKGYYDDYAAGTGLNT